MIPYTRVSELHPRSTASIIAAELFPRAPGAADAAPTPADAAAADMNDVAADMNDVVVPSTRFRFSTATPLYAGLISSEGIIAREAARQADIASLASRTALTALTPRMVLADMRAAAMRVGGGQGGGQGDGQRDDGGEVSWMRGMAAWCLLAALLVAAAP